MTDRAAPISPVRWRIASFAFFVLLILAWEVSSRLRLISPVFFPAPSAALAALWENFANGELGPKILGTLRHMFFGWFVASILAVVLGAVIGSWRAARTAFTPTLEFLRPLPVSAVIPVSIAAFGLSETMATFVIAFGTIWPMLLATVHGFADVNPRLLEAARMLRMPKTEVIRKISLPSALPDIFAGMRISVTVALILSVVCEIVAGLDGLGHWILLSARMFRTPELFAGVILLGLIGYGSALLVAEAERRVLVWRSPA